MDCYAGTGALFGGKDAGTCANCARRPLMQLLVELNTALSRQGLFWQRYVTILKHGTSLTALLLFVESVLHADYAIVGASE